MFWVIPESHDTIRWCVVFTPPTVNKYCLGQGSIEYFPSEQWVNGLASSGNPRATTHIALTHSVPWPCLGYLPIPYPLSVGGHRLVLFLIVRLY